MSATARRLAAIVVVATLVAARAAQPGEFLAFDAAPAPFPATHAAVAPAAPNVYAERADVRVLQLLSSMNGMWERAFAAAGSDYDPPQIEPRSHAAGGCGAGREDDWAGVYCFSEARIVIDMDDHLVTRASLGDDVADDRLGYVLAHEVAHHVMYEREIVHPDGQEGTVRAELYAECLAGVWGRAAGRRPPPAWSYAGDADHGTAEQQRAWLERGYAHGRPADCDAVWDADML